MPDIATLRERIAKACEAAIASGLVISSGLFRARAGECCPMGAFMPPEEPADIQVAAVALDVCHEWVWAFTEGFDGFDIDGLENAAQHPDAYELGQYFRRLYITREATS